MGWGESTGCVYTIDGPRGGQSKYVFLADRGEVADSHDTAGAWGACTVQCVRPYSVVAAVRLNDR